MYYGYKISDHTAALARQAEEDCRDIFKKIDENAFIVVTTSSEIIGKGFRSV